MQRAEMIEKAIGQKNMTYMGLSHETAKKGWYNDGSRTIAEYIVSIEGRRFLLRVKITGRALYEVTTETFGEFFFTQKEVIKFFERMVGKK